MPLPTDTQASWPPKSDAVAYAKFAEWSAWYGGDPERLRDFYAMAPQTGLTGTGGQYGGVNQWWKFWARIGARPASQKAQLHVPIAGDLAAVSGALLFGEEPVIQVAEAHASAASNEAKALETRLDEIIREGGVYARLVEAAESAAALGGAYIYPAWDLEMADYPIIAVAQADNAVPTFKWGMLASVVFHEVVERDGNVVTRHLESHDRGVDGANATIAHGLYVGSDRVLGERVDDARLKAATGVDPFVELPFPELDVEYIPNTRPNRLWRESALGLSDYSGSEGMLDALDEVYASWMRDIRLAKARIIVPRDYLDETGAMDVDHEVYTPMDMEPGAAEQGIRSMLAQQFAIRWEEHKSTIEELIERIVTNAGYSPQTFGLRIAGRAESGTALRIRESRTILTLKRKANWARPAVERALYHALVIDRALLGGPADPTGLTVVAAVNDGVPTDPAELATTAVALFTAQSASIETRVKLIHPNWGQDQVDAEVARIRDEGGPAGTGGLVASPPKPATDALGGLPGASGIASGGATPASNADVANAQSYGSPDVIV